MLQIVRHTTRSVGRRRWLLPKGSKPTSTQQQKQQQIEELQSARDRELLLQSYEQSLKGITPKEQPAVTEAFIRKNQQSVKVMEEKNAVAKSPSTMSNHEWMMHANAHYRATFADKVGSLPIIPARHMTIITCMDARIDPGKAMGIAEGDCHIIRNAGARIKDALRSLIISQEMMGTREVAIIHHTNCGACTLNEKDLIARIAKREQPADASDIDFMSFNNPDVFENVRREIQIYKQYQTLVQGIPVKGYVFDVKTGTLHHVHENANIEQEIADAQTKNTQTTTATTSSTSEQSSQNEQKENTTTTPITAAATATAAGVAIASSDDEQLDESKEITPSSPLTAGGLSGSLTRFMKLLSSNSF